jgi:hypothetical protein
MLPLLLRRQRDQIFPLRSRARKESHIVKAETHRMRFDNAAPFQHLLIFNQ